MEKALEEKKKLVRIFGGRNTRKLSEKNLIRKIGPRDTKAFSERTYAKV